MNKIISYILFLFVITQLNCFAQVNDAGLWLTLSAEKKVSQKFSIQLTECLRLNENFSELGTSYTEIGANYKIVKGLSIGGAYRFSQKRRVDDFYSQRHRYNIDLGYKLKVKNISLQFRERFQSQYKDIGRSETGLVPSNYFRSKLTVKYDLNKKYTPFISAELFYNIGNAIDNMRYRAGFDYEFNKYSTLSLYYMIDKEMNVKNPWTSYVIGLSYTYSF